MKARHLLKASLLATAVSLLTACGDDGDSTTPAAGAPAAAASVGVLTDAAVGGVAYTTAPSNLSGTTNAKGEYQFRAGDTVSFTLGGSTLQVPATGRITPATIAAHLFSGDDTKIANATTNLAVLFQTLDADNDPSNGITVDGSITLTGFTPATALAQAPATFTTTLDTALPASVEPVTPQQAIKHYYGNELTGSWKASHLKETVTYAGREETGIEDVDTDDNLGFLFSFDPQGRFIYSTWGLAVDGYDERSGDIAIGQVVYPETGTTISLTGHATRRLVSGTSFSATDPTEEFLDPDNTVELKLVNDKLVITLHWADDYDEDGQEDQIVSVLTLSRLQNQKNGLPGSWAELGGATSQTSVNADGTVDFGADVQGLFAYYVSSSRIVFVTLDMPTAGDDNEGNGLLVADYTRSGNTITLGAIKYDGVSLDEDNPVIEQGLSFVHGPVAADGRTAAYDYGDGDTGSIARILSRAELASFVAP